MAANMEIVGFIAQEPNRGVAQGGKSWLSVSVAHTPRKPNPHTKEWEDVKGRNGEDLTVWVRATFFDEMADYLGTILKKGTLVRLEGEPRMNAYLDKENQPRGGIDLWGASLTIVPRAPKGGSGASSGGFTGQSAPQGGNSAQNDGWANPGQSFGDPSSAPF